MTPTAWSRAGIAIAVIYGFGLIPAVHFAPPHGGGRRAYVLTFALLVLGTGFYLRFARIGTLHGGRLTTDEACMTRTFVSAYVSGEPVQNGATYLTHALLLDAWYSLFGLGTLSARYFTAAIASVGLACFFGALWILLDVETALWATAILSVSTYAVYFSVFALEAVEVLVFLPLNAFLLAVWLRRPSRWCATVLGAAVGASLFTYPGVIVAYAALVGGWALALFGNWLWARHLPRRALPPDIRRRTWPWGLAGFVPVIVTGVALHRYLYSQGAALFRGGGNVTISWAAYEAAVPPLLGDLFVGTRTWNLPFRGMPFVEWTFWPVAILGAWCLWRRRPTWWCRGAILSAVLTVMLIPFCGPYPGMRRGIYVLLPFSVCVGYGVRETCVRLGALAGGLAVLIAVAHPLYYEFTFGNQEWERSGFAEDFGAAPIPDHVLIEQLEQRNLVMSADEFAHPWDRGRHIAFRKLAIRHGLLHHADHTLAFASAGDPGLARLLLRQGDTALLTWKPSEILPRLLRGSGLCFRAEDLRTAGTAGSPAIVRLRPAMAATAEDVCSSSENDLASCVRLGARFQISRLVHDVTCTNAGCGPDRPTFVFVHPGSVSFTLKAPRGDSGAGGRVHLVLKVLYSLVSQRENRIFVNDHDLGLADARHLIAGDRLDVEIPPAAKRDSDLWSVRISSSGNVDRLGWDVFWAGLESVPPNEPPTLSDCLSEECFASGHGATCEDAEGLRAPERPSTGEATAGS